MARREDPLETADKHNMTPHGRMSVLSLAQIAPLPLIRLFQILRRFFLRAQRVVAGADRVVIFVDRALALARYIEDLAQIDVRPNFGPLRIQVAVQRFAKLVRRRLVVILREEQLAYAEVRQRAVAIGVQRLLILFQRVADIR